VTTCRVGIVGATGYTGMVLTRLLLQHPHCQITHLYARQYAGARVGDITPQFFSLSEHRYHSFDPDGALDVDVLFLALPHGTAHAVMPKLLGKVKKIIDLSADFRLQNMAVYEDYYGLSHGSPHLVKDAIYGLPELHRDQIGQAALVANPGCYATAVTLGLAPLAQAGYIEGPVIVDAKSGVSGAGRALKEGSLYCEVNEDFAPYGTYRHRHVPEMEAQLGVDLLFSPHLVPMTRGMLASMYLSMPEGISESQVGECFTSFYKDEPFIHLVKSDQMHTKFVSGSNHVIISWKWCEGVKRLVVFSAIDNLLKGASGQAIQNMNLMMGYPETMGLDALPLFM